MQAEKTTLHDSATLSRQDVAELYEQHNEALYRYAYRLLGDEDQAEEAVAETFSRLITAVKNGGGPGENARAYLYRVAHNWISDFYRRKGKQVVLEHAVLEREAVPPDRLATAAANPASVVSRRIEQERLRSALFQLTEDQRQVIALRFLEERTHDEISAVIGKTAEATRALQHRAIHTLRALLRD